MNRREAKRQVCACAARLLDPTHTNEWLYEDREGRPYAQADRARMEDALNELVNELWRRAT